MVGSSDFKGMLLRGQEMLEAMFGSVLVWNGDDYPCACGGARMSADLEDGGFFERGARVVRVRKDVMEDAPELGTVVEVDGVRVRVVGVSVREWDVAWGLEMEAERV